MFYETSKNNHGLKYNPFKSCIIPRPIAWITSLTDEGIDKRDGIVIENYFNKKIPLCGVLGGGYNKNFDKLVELHAKLHKSCANYF